MPFVPREIGNKFFVFHGGKSKRARGMREIRGGIIVVLHPGKCEEFSSASARPLSAADLNIIEGSRNIDGNIAFFPQYVKEKSIIEKKTIIYLFRFRLRYCCEEGNWRMSFYCFAPVVVAFSCRGRRRGSPHQHVPCCY